MKTTNMARIFLNNNLFIGDIIKLSEKDAHYLINVLRYKKKYQLLICNGVDGEWLAEVSEISKKDVYIEVKQLNKEQEDDTNINIIFSPIKQPRLEIMIEKCTELGVKNFIPVIMQHTVKDQINIARLELKIREAVEQSERLTMPNIMELTSLQNLIENWNCNDHIYICNEREQINDLSKLDISLLRSRKEVYVMIGPEGGYSAEELDLFAKCDFITSVHLGKRILRAETAAIMMVSVLATYNNNLQKNPSRKEND
jgi:16S rRNA (uracil1498-N3)-methyltransferase